MSNYIQLGDNFPDIKEHHKRILEALALRSILTPDKTIEEVCNDHGLTSRSIQQLKQRNPRVITYQNAVAEILLQESKTEAHETLISLLRSDNEKTKIEALKLYYQVIGRLGSNKPQITIENNGVQKQDTKIILTEIEELERRLQQAKKMKGMMK